MRARSAALLLSSLTAWIVGCPPADNTGDDDGHDDVHAEEAHWHQVLSGLPGALLSASGWSASDILAVGADPQDGSGPMVLRYDGASWRRLDTGATGDLWWITDRQLGDSFFIAGERGLVLEYEPDTDTFTGRDAPTDATLFGIWGSSATNVIAVGGDPEDPDTSGEIWRYDGANWTAEDLAGINPDGVPVLWKAWGRGANEVYVVGERGTILRYDGAAWTQLASPTTRTIFTVHGNSERVVACGGRTSGVIVELRNGAFEDVTPAGALQMNGTYVPSMGDAVTVGLEGAVAFGDASTWAVDETSPTLDLNVSYHAAWGDPAGGIWAVGGNIFVDPADAGVIAYYGTTDPATTLTGG